MNKVLIVITLVLLVACSKNNEGGSGVPNLDTLSAGWKKVNLPAGVSGIADIFFINNTTGFLGGGGTISRSTDGGNNWQKLYQSPRSIINITMGSANNAIFVTRSQSSAVTGSRLITTHNGGATFDSVEVADNYITDAFFVSPTTAYAVGTKFWKTTDGGTTWNPLHTFTASTTLFSSIYFLNEQTGWVTVGDNVYKTVNGGANWDPVDIPGFDFTNAASLFFMDANTGFVADHIVFGRTTNGINWTSVTGLSSGFHDIHFVSGAVGYVTDFGNLHKTMDGGLSWGKAVSLSSEIIVETHFTDANHGWACGPTGFILKFEQ